VKTGDLQHALQPLRPQHHLDEIEKTHEISERIEHQGVDQQRRIHLLGRRRKQHLQLALEITEQSLVVLRIAHHVAHQPLAMNALGKGTEVEADHRPLQPETRGGDDLVVAGLGLLDGHGPVIRRLRRSGSDARQCSD
jgi:hypothetical protein